MSRRRKSATSDKKSKDGATGSDEWSQEEKTRLLDALKEDDGENNWRWIARKVNTKTMAQVKQFAEKLNRVKRAVNKRSTPPSNKRPIAPKDNESLEEWINATKRLRGDDDVDGTCIPQSQNSRAQEYKDSGSGKKNDASSMHKGQHENSDNSKDKEQDSVLISDTDQHQNTLSPVARNDEEQVQRTNSIMEDLLTNQKEMMQKISLLESKLENLRSDDTSAQSSVMDMLIKINNRLDSLSNNAPHGCCGGPVIIQTTPHANVVHQPILDSCSSCSDSKQDKQYQSSVTVSDHDKEGIAIKDRNNAISTKSLSMTPIRTLSNPESILPKNNSGDRPPTILVLDSQEESSSKSQTITTSTQSPEITPRLCNIPTEAEPSVSTNQHEFSINVSCVPGTKTMTSTPIIKQLSLPESSKEQFSRRETAVDKESGSPSNLTRSVAPIVNPSTTITTTANTMLLQAEVLTASRQQRAPLSESSSTSIAPSQQTCATPYRETECLSHVAPVQNTPVPSLHSPYNFIDLQSTLTASPVLSSVVRSPIAKFVPVGISPETSRLPQQSVALASSSIAAASLQKSISGHTLRMPLHSITTTSAETNVPPGFITLSHTTNVPPSPNKIHGTSPLQPQTMRTTSRSPSVQGKDLHLSPAAGVVIQKAANEASAKQKLITSSPKEIMNAAMLISNYITEHPNPDNQAQWQSCLSAIVTDYHKNLDPSRGDLLKLVSIGYNPYVVLTQFELEDMLEKSKGRPKFFALRLAEKLYGIDVLIKSTPYGIGGKAALHPEILDAIKVEVLRRFAADMSNEGQTSLWKSCVTSIAQRCKRARNPRKDRSSKRMSASGNGLGPPSMAIGGGMQRNEHEENDDSQEESDDEDDEDCEFGSLDQPAARHTPPPLVRIPSDDEQEPSAQISTREVDGDDAGCITQAKDSSVKLKSSANSSVEKHKLAGTAQQDIPPGIDPDITVVHLPSNLQASVDPQTKQTDQRQSPVAARTETRTASSHEKNLNVTGQENARVDAQHTVSGQEPCESEDDCCSKEKNASPGGQFHGDYLQVVQKFPNPGASIESVIVSGIKMTPDYSHVLVGGNPNVVIPRQRYLDALTKSSQPTHFSVRLAELIFGDDVLEASTVTGGKRGTMQLDPVVINSIQVEVIDRFLKNLVPEQQNVVWRKCVTSIATRCKTLRYNRTKTAENHWTVRPSQISTE